MLFRLLYLIRLFQNHIFSCIIRLGFKKVGKNFLAEYPIRVIGGNHITIGDNFNSFGRLRIEAHSRHKKHLYNPSIIIGDNVSFNFDCHIGCINKVVIGDNVLIASRVFITDHYHGDITTEALQIPPSKRKIESPGPVIIEENVWIGEGVAIMPNLTIGRNSIIGSNAVVTKSFPPNSVIAGVPAKLIKTI